MEVAWFYFISSLWSSTYFERSWCEYYKQLMLCDLHESIPLCDLWVSKLIFELEIQSIADDILAKCVPPHVRRSRTHIFSISSRIRFFFDNFLSTNSCRSFYISSIHLTSCTFRLVSEHQELWFSSWFFTSPEFI